MKKETGALEIKPTLKKYVKPKGTRRIEAKETKPTDDAPSEKKSTETQVEGKKEVKTKESEIKNIYKSFQNNLDSLKVFIDTLSPVALEKDSNQTEIFVSAAKNILDVMGIKTGEDGKVVDKKADIQLSKDQVIFLANQLRKLPKVSVTHSKILYQSSFVLLVGYFEYLFADLLKYYYRYFPGNISDKPIQIIINELKEYDNIDDAIDYVISKEVEGILFDLNFNELIDFFNKKLNISLEPDIVNWDMISETRERRHIIVHNNAIINKKYLSKCKIDVLPDKADLTIEKKINVSNDYFNLAFNEIYLAGHILIFNCWKQWVKSDAIEVFNELLNTTFECLKVDLNIVVNRLAFYSTRLEAKSDKENDLQLRTKFNYLISLQLLEKKEDLEKELSQMKISSLSPVFKLAYYILKEDKNKILSNIKPCKLVDDMKIDWIHEWPLFKKIRADEAFLKQVEGEFNNC